MASFYRRWRPQTFDDLVGQEHIKKTLTNAIKAKKVAHAYLFTGPKGTGKTTTARLLAKSVNCQKVDYKNSKSKHYEPCNECDSCKEISLGQSLDVMEIDAASNRGIEEIRELRERVRFAPARSLYKVFIIDEVHMLTREAFNALLKTLEEPPGHVIFILATTEIHKVLPTIISRCQRFDFRRGQLGQIKQNLTQVVKEEDLKIDEEALDLLARMSDGSYRDGVTLLDQVTSVIKGGDSISAEEVRLILGVADSGIILDYLNSLTIGDLTGVVDLLGRIADGGGDLAYFATQIVRDVRRLILIKNGVSRELAAPEWNDEELAKWSDLAGKFSTNELMVLLEKLVYAIGEIKRAPLPQLPLEVLSINWMQEFSRLAKEGRSLVISCEEPVIVQDLIKKDVEVPNLANSVDGVFSGEEKKVEGKILENMQKVWEEVIEKVKPLNHSLYSFIKDANLKSCDQEKLVIDVKFRFHSERIHDLKNKRIIETAIEEVFGRPIRLECFIDEKIPKPKTVVEQDMVETAVEVFGMEE